LAELAQQFDAHPHQITEWKKALEAAADVFDGKTGPREAPVDLKTLHAKIGQLILENDFFRRRAHQGGIAECKKMIDPTHDLSIKRQAQLAGISRGTVYYLLQPVSQADLDLMRRIGDSLD
jgi:putative transposase